MQALLRPAARRVVRRQLSSVGFGTAVLAVVGSVPGLADTAMPRLQPTSSIPAVLALTGSTLADTPYVGTRIASSKAAVPPLQFQPSNLDVLALIPASPQGSRPISESQESPKPSRPSLPSRQRPALPVAASRPMLPGGRPELPDQRVMVASATGQQKRPTLPGKRRERPQLEELSVTSRTDASLEVEFEGRGYLQSSRVRGPDDFTGSIALRPQFSATDASGDHQFVYEGFARLDSADSRRTHVDIREAKYVGRFAAATLRVGIVQDFWGVTESFHLVDIINQDDFVEDVDQEDKLGQPMVRLSYASSDFGTLTGYLMTGFRKRRFPGTEGRPRFDLPVDRRQAVFEADDDRWHVDWALRWAKVAGPFDIGVSYFNGTARDPQLLLGEDETGAPVIVPRYELIEQVGVDVQGTFGALLLKGEAIQQWGADIGDFFAFVGGFEYTFFGIGGGNSDLSILSEYLYDERGATFNSPFEDDLFAGLRWAANDMGDTALLAGAIFDLDSSTTAINVEASRRLGQDWTISLDARLFMDVAPTDPLQVFADDDFIQLRLIRRF